MGGQNREFDMEVTPEREKYMKELIVRLLAHQYGADMESVTVAISGQFTGTKEPT